MSEKLEATRKNKQVATKANEEREVIWDYSNSIFVIGEIIEDLKFSHEVWYEKFYDTIIRITRTSGKTDEIPLQISERLLPMWNQNNIKGKRVRVNGQIRSYNRKGADHQFHLNLVIFAKNFEVLSEEEAYYVQDENIAYLEGYVCKPTVYRVTPFGRQICDVFLAVNRSFNKSDYIPCIVWGRNAVYAETFEVGSTVRMEGRFQSRGYVKKNQDGTKDFRIAYEFSAQRVLKL